jgi:ankyrin repeat protein
MADAKTNCPKCGGHIAFPKELVGQEAPCPHCNESILLPKTKPPTAWIIAAVFIFTTVGLASLLVWQHLAKHDVRPQARVTQDTNSQAVVSEKDALATGQLMAAVAVGDLKKVKVLLKDNPDLVFYKDTHPHASGRTLLHIAAIEGYKDLAALLLAKGAEVDAKDVDGRTPLDQAAGKDDKDLVELLLANGASVNARDNRGDTPLFWADESKDATELLLAKGAEVNVRNNEGNTLLYCAALMGDKKVVEVLLENKADVNVKNSKGETPLHLAALRGEMDVAELLLAYRADVNAKNDHGDTPLFYASLHKDMEELLRQHGGHE